MIIFYVQNGCSKDKNSHFIMPLNYIVQAFFMEAAMTIEHEGTKVPLLLLGQHNLDVLLGR